MNYEKIYFTFIEHFKSQEIEQGVYTEVHHIIPRYAGGSNDASNLVTLTYKQHVFVHRVWAKATNHPQALAAYRLMSGISEDRKVELASMAGKLGGKTNAESGHIQKLAELYGEANGRRNVESGHLENIRHLANTPVRQEKLKLLQERRNTDAEFAKTWHENISKGKTGKKATEEARESYRKASKKRLEDPEQLAKQKEYSLKSVEAKKAVALKRSQDIIDNAERNEEYLHMSSSRSKSKFVSPEGLVFDSPIFAAKYYGGEAYGTLLEKWCKTKSNGWYTIPKAE